MIENILDSPQSGDIRIPFIYGALGHTRHNHDIQDQKRLLQILTS